MSSAPQRLLVIGGNGFVGSAVCRAALSRGWDVHSLSTTGRPPTNMFRQSAAWTSNVTYHTGSALEPESYAHLLPESTAVVHTLGIMLEQDYMSLKGAARMLVLGAKARLGDGVFNVLGRNVSLALKRLEAKQKVRKYELINRDSVLSVLRTLLASKPVSPSSTPPTPFVFISADDVFRPTLPAKFVTSKWAAERQIRELVNKRTDEQREVTSLIVRPGILTHQAHPTLLYPQDFVVNQAFSIARNRGLNSNAMSMFVAQNEAISREFMGHDDELGPDLESLGRSVEMGMLGVDEIGEAVCVGIEKRAEGVWAMETLRMMSETREEKESARVE